MEIENLEVKENFTDRNNHFLLPRNSRGLIIGDSGCGKTKLLLNMILKGWLDFNKLQVFGKALHQPAYKVMEKGFKERLPLEVILNIMRNINEIQKHNITPCQALEYCGKLNTPNNKSDIVCDYFEKSEDVPDPRDLKTTDKNLIVFDDLMMDKKQNKCEDYYVRGRHNNIDCFYLSQNYFKIPKQTIRENTNFICLFEQDERNLTHIHRDHASKDMSFDEFKKLCHDCWQNPHDFIVIDKTSHKYDGKYRYKIDNFYYPKNKS